ncbi:MAG: hypothetical protein Q9160_005075 [Pyrenula sp. 1 TL-2023]
MSFGFSVGDFIAVGKLVADIISCLRAANGSRSEYQELARELENLARLLNHIDHLASSGVSSDALDSVKLTALNCRFPLEQLHTKIKKYEESLGLASHGRGWKTVKGKIQWRMCEPEEIQKLQMYLSTHVATINGLLVERGLEQMVVISQKAEQNHLQLKDRLDQTQGVIAKIGQNSTTVVAAVGSLASMMENLFRMVSGEITSSLKSLQNSVVNVCVMTQQIHGAVLEIRTAILTTPQTKMSWFQEPFCVEDGYGVKLPVPAEYDFTMLEGVIQLHLNRTEPVEAKSYRGFTMANPNGVEQLVKRETHLAPGTVMVVKCLEFLWGLENNTIVSRKIIARAEELYEPEARREHDELVAEFHPSRRMPAGIEINLWKSPFLRNGVWMVPHYPAGDDLDDPGRLRGSYYGTDFDLEGMADYYGLLNPTQWSVDGLSWWHPAPPMDPPEVKELNDEPDKLCDCDCHREPGEQTMVLRRWSTV